MDLALAGPVAAQEERRRHAPWSGTKNGEEGASKREKDAGSRSETRMSPPDKLRPTKQPPPFDFIFFLLCYYYDNCSFSMSASSSQPTSIATAWHLVSSQATRDSTEG